MKTQPLYTLRPLAQWLFLSLIVGILAGTASAAFLFSLDWATRWRESHRWIIAFLPLAGFLIGWVYHHIGRTVESGNNLLIDEIHNPQRVIPLRMTPLILIGSVITHLFGGSAGREGTAIQMGGSLADQLSRPFSLTPENRKILLMAGISGGFASVFGTPLAGTVFGLEVLSIGSLRYGAIFPCLVSALVGHRVTLAWGIHHSSYATVVAPPLHQTGFLYAALAGALFGITGTGFGKFTHGVTTLSKRFIPYAPLRTAAGGALVAGLVWMMGTTRYIGLGIPVIQESFAQNVHAWDFLAKILMTGLTLGFGFKGGEVTPLFFIGATLGNALSRVIPLPFPLLAGMGFAGVFAGAANTPIACTFMAIELFGSDAAIYMGIACILSYLCSGHTGIYHAQRIGASKHFDRHDEEGLSLRELH